MPEIQKLLLYSGNLILYKTVPSAVCGRGELDEEFFITEIYCQSTGLPPAKKI